MIALATGSPNAEINGDRILVSFPSGKDEMQVSLSLNQALHLLQRTKEVTFNALDNGFASSRKAELKPFSEREVANG